MKIKIRPYKPDDKRAVIKLWNDCGLLVFHDDPSKDIQRKRKEHPELFLIALENKKLVGVVMGGYDGHRGAVNYLAVDTSRQHCGIGRLLMYAIEKKLIALGCPKINLNVRVNNKAVIKFYEKIGYLQNTGGISFGKKL